MYQSFEDTSATGEVAGRIARLRRLLDSHNIDAFLVPRGDQHRGEYVAPSSERLAWISGFTGSAGFAVITRTQAALFTDGRYTVQARLQTPDQLFTLLPVPDTDPYDWIGDQTAGEVRTIGFDPWLHALAEIERATAKLKPRGMRLKAMRRNLVDSVWGADRPAPPRAPVTIQALSKAGKSAAQKLKDLQDQLAEAGQDATVLTAPDSICWLFNIRGSDVAHNPVCLCFAIIPATGKAELIIAPDRLNQAVRRHLDPVADAVPTGDFQARLRALGKRCTAIRLDAETCPVWIARQIAGAKRIARGSDLCVLPKAIKNEVEIRGARAAHARDGVAVCRFLAWLDREAVSGNVSEIGAARQLERFRAQTNQLKEISFDTISGSGPNGAIVHYRVTTAGNRQLGAGELYLVDSGAQYPDGTTDITRTIAIGRATEEMRDRFTRVLKGHIAIATANFPEGTRGIDLDPFARRALWDAGLDYNHGTGHGVGSYLSVHEGPQSISRRGMVILRPGMIISNEPGYYNEGRYGIRIENLVLVRAPKDIENGDRPMLSFETLTLAPIDRNLIDVKLLTASERQWLNAYHARVMREIGPQLVGDERAWLRAACAKI